MRETEAPTLRHFKIPTILVVGGSEELIRAVSEVALSMQVLVAECGVADVTDTATQMQPLLLAMTPEVYGSDASNFDALARDIRALVLQVGKREADDLSALEHHVQELMHEVETKRPSWAGELLKGPSR